MELYSRKSALGAKLEQKAVKLRLLPGARLRRGGRRGLRCAAACQPRCLLLLRVWSLPRCLLQLRVWSQWSQGEACKGCPAYMPSRCHGVRVPASHPAAGDREGPITRHIKHTLNRFLHARRNRCAPSRPLLACGCARLRRRARAASVGSPDSAARSRVPQLACTLPCPPPRHPMHLAASSPPPAT